MIYGYARVSTSGQGLYGNSLEDQQEKLTSAGASVIFRDVFTGTKAHRPELDRLMEEIRSGDTVIVTKLDRMARSAKDGLILIDEIVSKGAAIEILNMGKFDNTPMGKLMRTVALGFAEFERDMIVQRTSEGKAIAKQRPGYREGRKSVEYDSELFKSLSGLVSDGKISISEAAKRLGVSRAKWYRITAES